MIYLDGHTEFGKVVMVNRKELAVLGLYPNPAMHCIIVRYPGIVKVSMLHIAGTAVKHTVITCFRPIHLRSVLLLLITWLMEIIYWHGMVIPELFLPGGVNNSGWNGEKRDGASGRAVHFFNINSAIGIVSLRK